MMEECKIPLFPLFIYTVLYYHTMQNCNLFLYMTINQITNLAFGGHFGFSPPIHLPHME